MGLCVKLEATGRSIRESQGFSLIEMMISVAIVATVFFLSFDQIIALNKLYKKVDAQNQSRMDASLISEYLTRRLRQAGGNFVRPWMALWHENNCTARDGLPHCDGADRISYALLNRDIAACRVLTAQSPNRFHFNAAMPHCCSNDIQNQQLIVSNGGNFGSFYATQVYHDEDSGQCWMDVTPGQLYGINTSIGNFSDWSGADLAAVKTSTVYLDPNTRELHAYTDTNNNRSIEADEDLVIADQVVDLQFILGFDRVPQDGSVENLNSDQDEWLYNSVSANEKLGLGGLTGVTLSDLRMIGIGVVTEGRHYGQAGEIQIFDGPKRVIENAQLTSGQSRIYLRSTLIYNN